MESECCKVNSASRKFAKEWLKKLSKSRAAGSEQVKSPGNDSTPMARLESTDVSPADGAVCATTAATEILAQTAADDVGLPDAGNGEVHQSVEVCSIWDFHDTDADVYIEP